jgi:TonB family protein
MILLFLCFCTITTFCNGKLHHNIKTTKIGEQIWMTECLNVDHYRNGDIIPEVEDRNKWDRLKTGAWCYYNNDSTNDRKYGRLYNWYAVNDPRGLAPQGWRIPTKADFEILRSKICNSGNLLTNKGKKNFSVLFTGYRDNNGSYECSDRIADFWSSTENISGSAFDFSIIKDYGSIYIYGYDKMYGFNVRCLKEVNPINLAHGDSLSKGEEIPGMNMFLPLSKMPEIVSQAQPYYPSEAKKAGIEGTVYVKVLLSKEGMVIRATVIKSASEILNKSAVDAALKYVFTPALDKDNLPTFHWYVIPILFKLEH